MEANGQLQVAELVLVAELAVAILQIISGCSWNCWYGWYSRILTSGERVVVLVALEQEQGQAVLVVGWRRQFDGGGAGGGAGGGGGFAESTFTPNTPVLRPLDLRLHGGCSWRAGGGGGAG